MASPRSVLRRFATGYHSRNSELLVYGGFAVGAFLLVISYTSGYYLLLPFALMAFASTFYFQPFLDTENAQLGADSRGIYIRGLGHIPWNCVEGFRVSRTSIRSIEKASLQIKLKSDWEQRLKCKEEIPFSRNMMFKIWSKKPDNLIEVRLEHLIAASNQIEDSLTEIWKNRPISVDKFG